MHLLRTRLAGDIVAEFLPAIKQSNKVIFFCDGLPALPSKKNLLEFWAHRGYWVIHPRYRGTWESSGEFLVDTPDKDILDIIDDLEKMKKITSLWDNISYNISPQEFYIIGSSFGGATALMASRSAKIKKVACICPLIDWLAPSENGDFNKFNQFIKNAFGESYRFAPNAWEKMKTGNFFNPIKHLEEFRGNKIMLIQAADDLVCRPETAKIFAQKINCRLKMVKSGGHMSASIASKFRFYWPIKKFFNKISPCN